MKVLSREKLLEISKRLQDQEAELTSTANILIKDTEKFTQAKKVLGLPESTDYRNVAILWLKANPTLLAGQVVDQIGINDRYIGNIWPIQLDMDARYGPYQTG